MSTVLNSTNNKGNDFDPHPAGSFMAVLADVFIKTFPNKYKGQLNKVGKNKGKPDTRETVDKVCFAFLTEEPIEIDGQLKPRYASYWAGASLGSADYPSNARKFLKGWWPTLTDEIIDNGLDLDKFIGRGAYVTIAHSADSQGRTWANVTAAAQPPKGSTIPLIPADFVRHNDKPKEEAVAEQAQAAPKAVGAVATSPISAPLPSQKMPPPDLKVQQQARHAPPLTDTENAMPELDRFEQPDEVNPW